MKNPITKLLFGALASGIKSENALDLATIVLPEGSQTVAIFTQNSFCAAPIIVAKKHVVHDIRALIVNSGNANAGTGVSADSPGIKNAYRICELAAQTLSIAPQQVLPFSTGVIGQPLPMSCFERFIPELYHQCDASQLARFAQAILTTDTRTKIATQTFTYKDKTVNLLGIAKGSGMICPNMATMLAFIISDIQVPNRSSLQDCLNQTANLSFNRISVDGDTSTNDAVTLSATGSSGVMLSDDTHGLFQQHLTDLCLDLAHQIIKDGEGANKFVEICVKGGRASDACLQVAYSVAHSPLVKTALFASDANWGRILAAVGKTPAVKDINAVSIYLNQLRICQHGMLDAHYTEAAGSKEMAKSHIVITIIIGEHNSCERVWTTDLSERYVRINAGYRS